MSNDSELESIKLEAKNKAVDIYLEYLECVNCFIDKQGFLKHPHISVEVLDCITEDLTSAYKEVYESDSKTLVMTLREMVSIIDLYTPAFTIIRSYNKR